MKQKRLRVQLIISGGLLLCLMLLGWWVSQPQPALMNQQLKVSYPKVRAFDLNASTIAPQVAIYGEVSVAAPTVIKSPRSGDVESVLVSIGQSVTPSTLMMTMDRTDLKRSLGQRQADQDSLQAKIRAETISHKSNQKQLGLLERQRASALDSLDVDIKTEALRQNSRLSQLDDLKSLIKITKSDWLRKQDLEKKGAVTQQVVELAYQTFLQQQMELKQLQSQIDQHQHVMAKLEQQQLNTKAGYNRQISDVNLRLNTHSARMQEFKQQQKKLSLDIDSINEGLTESSIVSPVRGVVGDVLVTKGMRVGPNEPCIRLLSNDQVYIKADVPNDLYNRMNLSLRHSDQLKAYWIQDGSAALPLKFKGFHPIANGGQRVAEFLVKDLNSSLQLQQGLPVTLRLTLPGINNVYPIPPSSMYPGNYLMVIDHHSVLKRVAVSKVGYRWDENNRLQVLIRSDENLDGLQAVLNYQPSLIDGSKVIVESAKPKV